jgi:hypothetical protein
LCAQNWQSFSVNTDTVQNGQYATLKADRNGVLHASFWNEQADRLTYATRNPALGSSWILEEVSPNLAGGLRSALAFDTANVPHIAFYENVFGRAQLRLARRNGPGQWQTQTVSQDDFGEYKKTVITQDGRIQPSLTLTFEPDNRPLIVFFDGKFESCNSTFTNLDVRQVDDFNRPDGANLGRAFVLNTPWVAGTSTTNSTAAIQNGQLNLSAAGASDAHWARLPLNYGLRSDAFLGENKDVITWAFNWKVPFDQAQGWADGQRAAAVVLAATNPDFLTTGQGFALVLDDSEATDSLRLVYFINGLRGERYSITGVPNTTGKELSIKVTYNPFVITNEPNTWKLYVQVGGGVSNPAGLNQVSAQAVYQLGALSVFPAHFGVLAQGNYNGVITFDNLYTSTNPNGLEMMEARPNDTDGYWDIRSFGNIPAFSAANEFVRRCEGNLGARYGEYPVLFSEEGTGQLTLTTFAKINGDLLRFRRQANSSNWDQMANLDSIMAITNDFSTFRRTEMTFEGLSGVRTAGSLYHLTYSFSDWYGRNIVTNFPFQIRHARFTSDGSFLNVRRIYPPVGSSAERSYLGHTSMTSWQNDTLALGFHDQENNTYILGLSYDAGTTWNFTSLVTTAAPDQEAPLAAAAGKLHALYYDRTTDQLFAGERAFAPLNAPWSWIPLTRSSLSGGVVSSVLTPQKNLVIAYSNAPQKALYLAEQQNRTSFIINQVPLQVPSTISALFLTQSPTGELYLAYADETQFRTVLARRTAAGVWNFSTLDAQTTAAYISGSWQGSVLHLAYFDVTNRNLKYVTVDGLNIVRNEIVDTDPTGNGFVGEFASLALFANGQPAISYFDRSAGVLKYALRNELTGQWQQDTVYRATDFQVGQFSQLAIGNDQIPQIGFRFPANNFLMYARRPLGKPWQVDTVLVGTAGNVGAPLVLRLDSLDQPWIAYNIGAETNVVQLVYKSLTGLNRWIPVPVFNNRDQIGVAFSLLLDGWELFIPGRKNRLGAQGIGWLQGRYALPTTDREDDELTIPTEQTLVIYPNPVSDRLTIQGAFSNQVAIQFYDPTGRLVAVPECELVSNTTLSVRLSGLKSGIYLGKLIQANGKSQNFRIVKE